MSTGIDLRIDNFNQWGVELGKVLASKIAPELESETEPTFNQHRSTNNRIPPHRAARR